jgi:Domain of unknown function (DUF4157)
MSTAAFLQTATAKTQQPASGGLVLQRKCACGSGTSSLTGECEECRKKKMLGLQTKLRVSEPGEVSEKEADRVADQMLRMSAPRNQRSNETDPIAAAVPAKVWTEEYGPLVQLYTPRMANSLSGVVPNFSQHISGGSLKVREQLSVNIRRALLPPSSPDQLLGLGSGRPLSPSERAWVEPHLGWSLRDVRIHSIRSPRRAGVPAGWTFGRHVGLRPDRLATSRGRHVLAHELTHIAQQSGREPILQGYGGEEATDVGYWFELAIASVLPPMFPTSTLAVYEEDHPLWGYLNIWGQAFAGDFVDDPTLAAIIIRTLLTLIPGVDTAADVEDMAAAFYQLVYLQRYNEVLPWFSFVLSLIGFYPELGSIFEGVARAILIKGGGLALSAVVGSYELLAKHLDTLEPFVRTHGRNAFERTWEEANRIRQAIATLEPGTVLSWLFPGWNERVGEVLRQFDEQIMAPLEAARVQVNERIDQVLSQLRGGTMSKEAAITSGATTAPTSSAVATSTPSTSAPSVTSEGIKTPIAPMSVGGSGLGPSSATSAGTGQVVRKIPPPLQNLAPEALQVLSQVSDEAMDGVEVILRLRPKDGPRRVSYFLRFAEAGDPQLADDILKNIKRVEGANNLSHLIANLSGGLGTSQGAMKVLHYAVARLGGAVQAFEWVLGNRTYDILAGGKYIEMKDWTTFEHDSAKAVAAIEEFARDILLHEGSSFANLGWVFPADMIDYEELIKDLLSKAFDDPRVVEGLGDRAAAVESAFWRANIVEFF